MIAARFEDDMAEVSGCGYLLLCAGRKQVFMEGVARTPVPLADVRGLAATDGAIVVRTAQGDLCCPFDGATAAELGDTVTHLNACLDAWR